MQVIEQVRGSEEMIVQVQQWSRAGKGAAGAGAGGADVQRGRCAQTGGAELQR